MIAKKNLLLALLVSFTMAAFSQGETEAFKPYGKPFMKVFTNFHSTTTNNASQQAFDLTRLYLGYEYFFSENLSAKANFDIGDPGVGSLQMTAYAKNAYLKYKKNNLSVSFGLIPTTNFEAQESNWGYRYVAKSFQDEYKFAASADLGISAAYKLGKYVNLDASVLNGEGYKSLENDSVFKYVVGATLSPIKSLTVRGSFDTMKKGVNQNTLNAFVGYAANKLTVGAEYNQQMNNKMKADQNLSGASVYATYAASGKFKVFARFDQLTSNTKSGESVAWNNSKDGQLMIAGLEYAPVKGVKISPNFQSWSPADASKSNRTSLFLNCELKF